VVINLNKPFYLMPFIFVYKIVSFVLQAIVRFIKYFNIGLFFTLFFAIDMVLMSIYHFIKLIFLIFIYTCRFIYKFIKYVKDGFMCSLYCIYKFINYVKNGFIYSSYCVYKSIGCIKDGFVYLSYFVYKVIKKLFQFVYEFFKYIAKGFIYISYIVYRFIRYVGLGFAWPIVFMDRLVDLLIQASKKAAAKRQLEQERRNLARERNKLIQEENRKRLIEIKQKQKEERAALRKTEKDVYVNDNVTIEKKTLSDRLNEILVAVGATFKKLKDRIINNRFVKDAKNKNELKREALLLNFDSEDAEKSERKVMYKYVAKNPDGKIIKGYFPAYSKVEVHSFLLSEGNEVYSIETNKWIQARFGDGENNNTTKIKTKDLIFFCTQLSTYIKAGIPLVEALRILSRQFKNREYIRIFKSMIYELTMGDSFSTAMDKQGKAFPKLLINMVKSAEMTGVLPEVLDDMSDYFTEMDKTRKQMVTALTYPAIIFVLAIAAIIFIMVWVVPQFVNVYSGISGSTLPPITVFVMNASEFLQKYYLYLIIGIIGFVLIFIYLYKNVKAFRAAMQWLAMHVPAFGNVIIYNEVTMFTKTFASLLSHNVFITDSMEILNKITNNEIYKMLILDTIANLAKGEKISLAFKDHWAFPLPAYEMITTGERTGQLPEMMQKVSSYYQDLHRNSTTRIKTFVEPALILFLTFMVGGIVLSIVIPMFSIYQQIQV